MPAEEVLSQGTTTLGRSARYLQRALSLVGACLCTGTSASVYAFSTYGPALAQKLHLNTRQASIVAIAANFGFLFSGPLAGRATDIYGPKRLAVMGAVLVFSMFLCLAYTYKGVLPWSNFAVLALYEALMGIGAQCSSMAAITTTGKNFKRSRGTAISVCNAFFGLTPLLLSQINTFFFISDEGTPDTFGYIRFLGITGGCASLIAALCLVVVGFGPSKNGVPAFDAESIIPPIADSASATIPQPEAEFTRQQQQPHHNDTDSWRESMSNDVDESSLLIEDSASRANAKNHPQNHTADTTPLLTSTAAAAATAGPQNLVQTGVDYDFARDLGGLDFVRDTEAQLLSLVMMTGAGIGVFYFNSVGTIVNSLYSASVAKRDPNEAQALINFYVSLVSIASFSGRLLVGPTADIGKRLCSIPRSSILVCITLGIVASQIAVGATSDLRYLWVGTVLTGFFYGSLFSLIISLTSTWFGNKHFGSNVGLLTLPIPVGAEIYGFIFGSLYDSNVPDGDPSKCTDGYCYRDAFIVTTAFALACLLFATVLARHRSMRRYAIREMLREESSNWDTDQEIWRA